MELCRALRASRSPSTRLRLRIGKLDMSCLGVPRTVVLLEQLEPDVCIVGHVNGMFLELEAELHRIVSYWSYLDNVDILVSSLS